MGSLIQISYFSCKTEHNKQRTPLVCYWERIIYSEVKDHFCQHNFMGRITYQMLNLHILVIWAISFKAHKTLSLEKQESLIILFSLYISRKGSISTKGFFFFSVKSREMREHEAESRGSPKTSLYEYLKTEKCFSSKCAKKEGRQNCCIFISKLDSPQPLQL